MSLADAKSILIHLERLSSHILNFDEDTDVAIYCTLGDKVLKTATATVTKHSDAPINFDSLLQFPLNYPTEDTLVFVLKDKTSQKELGRYDLNLSVFNNQDKPSHLVRIKIKNNNKGVGLIDMKIRVSDGEVEKPASAKYVKHSNKTSNTKSNFIPDFENAPQKVNSLNVAVYKIREMPVFQSKLVCTVKVGDHCVLMESEGECEEDVITDGYSLDFTGIAQFPYSGERIIQFNLGLDSSEENILCSGETDLTNLIMGRPNVLLGCVKVETKAEQHHLGVLFVRIERCTAFAENGASLIDQNQI